MHAANTVHHHYRDNVIFPLYLHSSLTIEYEEDYEDVTVNQMLAPRTQDIDTTEILNNLLKEYDKKLRPDIGGKSFFFTQYGTRMAFEDTP